MRRREFIAGLGGAAAWPVMTRAQQSGGVRRVGVLMNSAPTDAEYQSYFATFVQGLRQLGWTEGKNLHLDVRWTAGDAALAKTYSAQLMRLTPDAILANTTVNLTVIHEVSSTVPIVFVEVSDPVAQGFVASIRQPGGNITGFTFYEFSIGGRWLDLLKEAVPGLTRVAVMFNPDASPQSRFFMRAIEAAAPSLGLEVIAMPVLAEADIEPALAGFARQPNGGLILSTSNFTRLRYSLIAKLTEHYRLPSIAGLSSFAKQGGLMDYSSSIDLVGQFRQAASYIDRILKGEKPGGLPVQAPDKYVLVINLKAARALSLTMPEPLLATADEVIQ
jgi:putative ABC transport system substrate-binding protein